MPTKKAKPLELGDPAGVVALLAGLTHPKKAEIQAVRAAILEAAPQLQERVKWKAPSFFLSGKDLGAFNLRHEAYAHFIMLFPMGLAALGDSPLFEGKHVDRRELKFHSLEDVAAKRGELTRVVQAWVRLVEATPQA